VGYSPHTVAGTDAGVENVEIERSTDYGSPRAGRCRQMVSRKDRLAVCQRLRPNRTHPDPRLLPWSSHCHRDRRFPGGHRAPNKPHGAPLVERTRSSTALRNGHAKLGNSKGSNAAKTDGTHNRNAAGKRFL